MIVEFQGGKIIAKGRYHEKAKYDMAGDTLSVVADGCGGLSSYRVNNVAGDFIRTFLSLDISVAGESLSPYLPKTVEMIGRTQKVCVHAAQGDLTMTTFLSAPVNGVFIRVEASFPFDLSVNYRGDAVKSARNASFVRGESFLLSSSVKGDWAEENAAFYLPPTDRADLLISFVAEEGAHKAAFAAFDSHLERTLREIDEVKVPFTVRSEAERALFFSAYFTALENYKSAGDFAAFAAGVNYMDPLRTYFRDSYFTVLPLLHSRPDMVESEILTLARGIKEDGSCPSAVKSDFTSFWGDHYDSPCFFMMELYDYVTASGDDKILKKVVNGKPLLEIAKAVIDRISTRADETGLIYKEGDYNKRDWADEVNRGGYVTFVNALYYRALVAASRLFESMGDAVVAEYARRAAVVKQAMNEILFDETKGYYVNYKTKDFTEDNLSIDTVFAVIFGVADDQRGKRVLDNMERLLETQHNLEQGGGDFGVMCVYPPYKVPRGTCHKSSHPYDYHNGANWCYLTAMYAYAKSLYGMDWRTPLLSSFRYYTERGGYTPVEYFSPACAWGSALQGWSAAMAFTYLHAEEWFD